MPTAADLFNLAWQTHQAGAFGQAQQHCEELLRVDPGHIKGRLLLGLACQSQGDFGQAESHFRRLLQLCPGHASAGNALGILKAHQNKLDDAAAAFQEIIDAHPTDADAHNNLGTVLAAQNKHEEAAACFERALQLQPSETSVKANLDAMRKKMQADNDRLLPLPASRSQDEQAAQAQHQYAAEIIGQGRFGEARLLLESALRLHPDSIPVLLEMAQLSVRLSDRETAIVNYRRALQLGYDEYEAHYLLALLLCEKGEMGVALPHFERVIQLRPNWAAAYLDYNGALQWLSMFEKAVQCCEQAVRLEPELVAAHAALGTVLIKQGRLADAMASFRQAIALQPGAMGPRSNLLFCLNYDPEAHPDAVFAEHRIWGQMLSAGIQHFHHGNDRSGDRRLRIGYVSADFVNHALSRYLLPVLTHHDSTQVEIHCYADVRIPDPMTAQMQRLAHGWRWTVGVPDVQFAQQVQEDRIDILVDLSGHTGNNRLGVFAYKPAPIQATWLGYMNTTGLSAIDYRLTDGVLDPPGQPIRDTEELFRLSYGMCCYLPPDPCPAVSALPALRKGLFTFGGLHNTFKLNDKVIDLWRQVLLAVPQSLLLLFHDTLTTGVREQLRQAFERRGIGPERLDLRQGSGKTGYLRIFEEIDLVLDTFPCGGGVTTCEALWMGAPVITLCGERPAGRNSTAILTRIGLADWSATSPEQYIAKAVEAAAKLDRVAAIRSQLRDRMLKGVCDGLRLTRELEQAYRTMWRRWRQGTGI